MGVEEAVGVHGTWVPVGRMGILDGAGDVLTDILEHPAITNAIVVMINMNAVEPCFFLGAERTTTLSSFSPAASRSKPQAQHNRSSADWVRAVPHLGHLKLFVSDIAFSFFCFE